MAFRGEFYIAFCEELTPKLTHTFNKMWDQEEMIETLRTSVVALLHKKKSRENMRNYRPISLTCVDYKILSKIMANRMGSTLHLVISERLAGGNTPARGAQLWSAI